MCRTEGGELGFDDLLNLILISFSMNENAVMGKITNDKLKSVQ